MTMSERSRDWGQVLPFARSASQLHIRAVSQRKGKQWPEAAELLRRAMEIEPDNAQVLLELANTYSQIGLSQQANKLLLKILRLEPERKECLFDIGLNYYNMQAWAQAGDCMRLYILACPFGKNRKEAESLLSFLFATGNSRMERRMQRATRAYENGKYELTSRLMRRAFAASASNGDAYAVAAFLKLSEGDPADALRLARQALRLSPQNTRALCAVVVSLGMLGSRPAADSLLDRAINAAETEAERIMTIHTACEIGLYQKALSLLLTLQTGEPLEPSLSHLMAVCYCHTGKIKEALPIWARMRRLDPEDTVSDFFFETARAALAKGEPYLPSHVRTVPMDETLRRLARIRTLADGGTGGLERSWKKRDELRRLVQWGLNQPESRIKKVMIGLLRIAGDEDARWILRYALLSTEHSDEIKQEILESLFEMGDPGPHYVSSTKGFGAAYVQVSQEAIIPKAQDDELVALAKSMPEISNALGILRWLWQMLLREENLLVEIEHWMMAAEFFIRSAYGLPVDPPDRRVMRRVRRIEQLTADEGGLPDDINENGTHIGADKSADKAPNKDEAAVSNDTREKGAERAGFAIDAFPTFEGWLDAQESNQEANEESNQETNEDTEPPVKRARRGKKEKNEK